MAKVKLEDFNEYALDDLDILSEGDEYDSLWGVDSIALSKKHIKALKGGKVLYWNNGEYATLVRLL